MALSFLYLAFTKILQLVRLNGRVKSDLAPVQVHIPQMARLEPGPGIGPSSGSVHRDVVSAVRR